ncbi:MAG: pseudaminic acid cytidylyltransferase [Alphaproteobacteria bacterium]|nr:pseudaminic acid cytidylyltransferase [Alphaproteobacteria bacterium]
MRRLCIIPARDGSKRIPHKNIKDFCGKPMIVHAIGAALTSGLFSRVHVSTDSETIADVSSDAGAKVDFMRPANLSGDHTTMMEVVRFVTEEYERRNEIFDTVVLIYATSPLIDPKDLKGACAEFEAGDKTKALLAVAPFPAPIEQAFRILDDGALVPDSAESLAMRTQDLKPAYYDAGMFAIYTPAYIAASSGAGDFMRFRGFPVPSYRVTDIDWPDDWERAEKLYRAVSGDK